MWSWIFPGQKKEEEENAPDAMNVINKTSESLDALQARRVQTLRKAHDLEKEARELSKTDPKRALQIMKRKQMYDRQALQLEGQIQNLEQTSLAVESAAVSVDVANTMKEGSRTMGRLVKTIDVDEIGDVTNDISGHMNDLYEINRVLGAPMSIINPEGEDIEEEEARLLKEINSWNEKEQLEEAERVMEQFPKPVVVLNSNNDDNTNGGNGGGQLKIKNITLH